MKNTLKISVPLAYCLLLAASCTVNKATNDLSLKKYFDENNVDGCFTMLNNADGEITVYNMKLDTMRFSPASTFKIVNSLIGLQTGRITDENMVIKWDGITRSYPGGDTSRNWNKDMNMTEAFKTSCVPFYQEVARRIGKDTMQHWIDSIGYGNKDISGPVDSFWLNDRLKISPDEQLGLVKKLYFDQLPFRKTAHQLVKDAMLQEDNSAYKLSYKTGRGYADDGNAIGWVVGWIEENRHVYFFVTLVKALKKDIDMPAIRMNITKGILKQYGFFEGKK